MRQVASILTLALAMAVGSSSPSSAAVISNGSLTVTIRDDNGAIDAVVFGGSDFYNPGTPVSDWMLQQGADESTFGINTTEGFEGINVSSVSLAGGVVTAIGSYGGDVTVTREYWIVPGLDVLRTRTTLNLRGGGGEGGGGDGDGELDLRLVDTFDPDQGIDQGAGFGTFNDVYTLSGVTVARSSLADGLSVVMGGFGSTALAFGCPDTDFGLGVNSGAELNGLFDGGGCDPDGAFADIGIGIGFAAFVLSGESVSFTFDQAYGTSIEEAEDDFETAAVPEPGTLVLLGSGLATLLARSRRRRA